MAANLHVLIVEARFYEEIADHLLAGAKAELDANEVTYDVVTVPGALEAPAAVAYALAGADGDGTEYDGFVVLGCVIRGETYHFEIVAGESARGLMALSMDGSTAIGNGILTVENEAQALERADAARKDKGGGAARTVLEMIALRDKLGA
ncbi:6,7-dimethyl-8-ribityllumazine synthase [Fulvimarina sp. 2208YS6-2-32]|uniref:6,7-dimethyl-8-ribityllumazine synthase n=1 Tax=Fulvimarina uroteuthidis TaxID=3098149 RepID=A0ABU5I2K6_9HYPH|nr:6,7-dimethyl-8-ribityllumazine synthase [Fulvimarina sp. 2208YS6-2-32]MDY8109605.1 6,7-dimethyl-8-ribityllumazine synthase [Fulvimarina sp. 2208YS6-2-32]